MRKHAKLITASLLFALTAILVGCGIQLQAVGGGSAAAAGSSSKASSAAKGESRVVYKFFDEDFVSGGYQYVYPDASKVEINENEANVKLGEASLQFDLVADDYSGGSVCLYNMMYDMNDYYAAGALQFWVKGSVGNEIAWAALVDDEGSDGKKTVVRLPIDKYTKITTDWTLVSIPLRDFGKRGVFWDAKARVEVPEPFQWDKVTEFRIEIKKNENKTFRVWVDEIVIVSNVFDPSDVKETAYWDDREYTLPALPSGVVPAGLKEIGKVLNKGDVVPGGFTYVYGGKTAYKVQETEDKGSALALYMDQTEYSGVTISIGEGKYINLARARTAPSAGLAFWGKSGPGTVNLSVGLMDNKGNDIKTQTKVFIGDYGVLDGEWKFYMIPIRMFHGSGLYWDANRGAEVNANVDWSKIQEVRVSVNRNDERNRNIQPGEPAIFYISDVSFIEEIPGYVNPEDYWNAFKSDAPDVMLHDFETEIDQKWGVSHGPKSEGSFTYGESGADNGGSKSLHMTYRLNDWVDFIYSYNENNRPKELRDWTKHWGLKFDFYTDKPYQPITVQINDSGNEIFVAASGGNRGWNEVVVPFRNFTKFPYYQPDDAVQNGKFDLENVFVLDFKPAGEGSRGTFRVDNVRLTNDREAKKKPQPTSVNVKVSGDLNKAVTEKINEGIFGINVALWDGDLLLPETEKYVRDVNHHVLRYPGGLRADDDDWEDILRKKDWMVDTDEYFDFMKKTNTGGMITVNFGTGTPEKAARWVAHAKAKKAPVTHWEIGNELYGAWHPNVTSGDDYGKRAREFAIQMKKADPNAKITAVWMLDGEWNRETFVHLKDVVDGVNVHHYPQHAGQENDAGLLAAPQTLPDILGSVRRQTQEFGVPGKHYEIWLTEWNSVDFDPGPQTMGIVNALFVADYLGMLTKVNIEQASYWDVHNSITPEGGDYGYLSRRGAPDGDNVPRSSYWAFKMASHSLGRGSLLESNTGDDNITSYLTVDGKKKSLMLINKYPKTVAEVEINVPDFAGKAKMLQLTSENSGSPGKAGKGPDQSSIDVKPGMKVSLPAYSVTTITIE